VCKNGYTLIIFGGKIKGGIEGTGRQGRRGKQLLEIERGNIRSHCVENWLWKKLWTCRKTDSGKNEY
jgi:hypothetical protein